MNNQREEQEWDFEAPKFWDFSDTIPQERPTDAWFCIKHVSNPSFGAPKKRRTLRVFKYGTKASNSSSQAQDALPPKRESVFDRLSRESTISFSRKTNQPLTPQQKQHVALHAAIHEIEDYSDQELITHASQETVEERIARLEGTYIDQARPFGLGKKTFKLKQNISHTTARPPTQSLFDELSQAEEQEKTQESIDSYRTQPIQPIQSTQPIQHTQPTQPIQRPMAYSPVRQTIPVSPMLREYTTNKYLTPRRESTKIMNPRREPTKMMSPILSVQTASPIRKPNPKSSHNIPSKMEKVVSNFFDGLLKMAKEKEEKQRKAKELRAKHFFENLLKANAARPARAAVEIDDEDSTYESAFSNSELFSPRKRLGSIGTRDQYTTSSSKRSKFDLN